MKILKLSAKTKADCIKNAVLVLKTGGIVIYPTETCYGVAVDATNQAAVDKLLKYKQRPEGKAISILVVDKKMAEKYAELNLEAEHIYKQLLPGPITVISRNKNKVANGLASEKNTLGIRLSSLDFAANLVEKFGYPITATSANAAGKKTPYKIEDITKYLSNKQKDAIDLIIDAGELPHNPPSTVIDTTTSELQILRQGKELFTKSTKEKSYEVSSPDEMIKLGEGVGEEILDWEKPTLILLQGELGAGKTHFVKGVAKGLGVDEVVKSPSYLIVKEYQTKEKKRMLVHADFWRVETKEEFYDLGIFINLMKNNILAIEWVGGFMDEIAKEIKGKKIMLIQIDLFYLSPKKRKLLMKIGEI